jgi:hypothetical protein
MSERTDGAAPAENSLPFYTPGEEESVHSKFRSMMGSIPPGGIHGAEV